MVDRAQEVYLVRHGETEWSLSGQHTGTTDIPLTDSGRVVARRLQPVLAAADIAHALTSPLRRARETCDVVGLGEHAAIDSDLVEWSYGEYEGLTPRQIHDRRPGWMIFRDGCPGGETPAQIGARVDRVIARVRELRGNVALFAHGHVFRVLVARWIGLPAGGGQHFMLEPATLSVLGCYRDSPAIKIWNAPIAR